MAAPELLHVALYKPEIHPNTGNIARLCAANCLPLHLVGALGFRIDDRSVRRHKSPDYWPFVDLRMEETIEELHGEAGRRAFLLLQRACGRRRRRYQAGDCLIFGPESTGLPADLLHSRRDLALRIPMRSTKVRSLNLATAAGIAVYEALRQLL